LAWTGRFLARYPDGTGSDFDLNGFPLRPGDPHPARPDLVLDRWETHPEVTGPDGRLFLIGVFREAEKSPEDS
jgi:hypothetical protein